MSLAQVHEHDEATNFQRARRSELMKYCRQNGINVAGDATKDDMLKVVGAAPLITARTEPRRALPETDDEKRTRLRAELAELEGGGKIFTTKILNGEEEKIAKPDFENMMHHKKKEWLKENSPKAGVEVRFPGNKGKGPEVSDECERIFAML